MGCSAECVYNSTGAMPFKGDSDIAGIGVISAFLATAWFTCAMAILCYFIKGCMPSESINGVDDLFMPLADRLQRALGPKLPPVDSLQNVMLMLGDMQIVTGTSIYIVAYWKHCEITQYHFAIAVLEGMAALSTYTLIAITTRPLLRGSMLKRFWRWPWVMALCITSIIGSFIHLDDWFLRPHSWGLPMDCAWKKRGRYSGSAFFVLLIDVWGPISDMAYTTMVFFPRLSMLNRVNYIESLLIMMVIFLYKKAFNLHRRLKRTKYSVLKIFMVFSGPLCWFMSPLVFVTFFLTELFTSHNFQLLTSLISMSVITTMIVAIRREAKEHALSESENKWGFGQLLPILLLAIPFFETAEAVPDQMWQKKSKPNKPLHDPAEAILMVEIGMDNNPRPSLDGEYIQIGDNEGTNVSTIRPSHDLSNRVDLQGLSNQPLVDNKTSHKPTPTLLSLIKSKMLKCPKFLRVARESTLKELREYHYRENRGEMRLCITICYGLFIAWYIWWQAEGNIENIVLSNTI